jgi:hypothetical protein
MYFNWLYCNSSVMEYNDAPLGINYLSGYVTIMVFVAVSENIMLLLSWGFEKFDLLLIVRKDDVISRRLGAQLGFFEPWDNPSSIKFHKNPLNNWVYRARGDMHDGTFPESVHFMDLRQRKSHGNVSSLLLIYIYEQPQLESFWRQEITCIFSRRIMASMIYSFHQIPFTQNSESNHPAYVNAFIC